ncbi:hypothetical protein TRVA0_015S02124 [Trichomonascus vanleenenianus]|uniref:uncharacterized protein n=1 Tax=Trichomonascus vanleenenianus TaxID=2268995 RepID=UPI003ECA5B7C
MGFVCLFVCFSSFSRLSIMSQVAIDSARHHDPLSSSTNTPWARRFKKSYSPSSSTSTPAVYVAKPVTFIGEVPYAPEGAKANRRFQGAWLVRDDGHINQTVEKQQQQSADDSVAETVPILVVPDGDGEQREGPRSPSHQTPDPIAESSYSTHSGGSGSDIASPDIDYSAPRLPPYPPPPQICNTLSASKRAVFHLSETKLTGRQKQCRECVLDLPQVVRSITSMVQIIPTQLTICPPQR